MITKRGISDVGIAYDRKLVFMARWPVLPGSWSNRKILKEPPLSNLQFLSTSKEKPFAGTMYLNTLQ